jgi:hypothetical protein
MYEGRLPEPICERCGEPSVRSLLALPFTISINYLLMVLALIALCLPESPGFLRGIAFVGGICDLYQLRSDLPRGTISTVKWDFERTFYGHIYPSSVRHVHYRWLMDPLLIVMVVLFIISVTKDLDRRRFSGLGSGDGADASGGAKLVGGVERFD